MSTSLSALRTRKSLHVCNVVAFWCRMSQSTPFLLIISITTVCCLWHLCSIISTFRTKLGKLHHEANPAGHGSFLPIQGYSSFLKYFQISFLGGHRRHFPGWTDSVPRSRGMSESIQPSSASMRQGLEQNRTEHTMLASSSVYLLLSQEPVLITRTVWCFRVLPVLFQPWLPLFHELVS